jgi:hypothetical protein
LKKVSAAIQLLLEQMLQQREKRASDLYKGILKEEESIFIVK